MTSKSSSTTVFWWIGWIVLTIASFFVASSFWTPIIAKHIGSMTTTPAAPLIWVALVFGSWMVLLVPLIIVMYQKVDKSYEDARSSREESAYKKNQAIWAVRAVTLPESQRKLSAALQAILRTIPETLKNGHLVHLRLKDRRLIEHAFILNKKELLGVYNRESIDFDAEDIAALEPVNLDQLPPFESNRWLRLDGVGSSDL